jgi:hypothetical protein
MQLTLTTPPERPSGSNALPKGGAFFIALLGIHELELSGYNSRMIHDAFCTAREAAELLDRSIPQVVRYCQTGKLQAELMADRWLISREAIREFKIPKRGNPNWVKGYKRSPKKKKK